MILNYKTSCHKIHLNFLKVDFSCLLNQFPNTCCVFCKRQLGHAIYPAWSFMSSICCKFCKWSINGYNHQSYHNIVYQNRQIRFRYDADKICLQINNRQTNYFADNTSVDLQTLLNQANSLIKRRKYDFLSHRLI